LVAGLCGAGVGLACFAPFYLLRGWCWRRQAPGCRRRLLGPRGALIAGLALLLAGGSAPIIYMVWRAGAHRSARSCARAWQQPLSRPGSPPGARGVAVCPSLYRLRRRHRRLLAGRDHRFCRMVARFYEYVNSAVADLIGPSWAGWRSLRRGLRVSKRLGSRRRCLRIWCSSTCCAPVRSRVPRSASAGPCGPVLEPILQFLRQEARVHFQARGSF